MLGCPLRRDQNNFFCIILQLNCSVIPFKFAFFLLCFCLYLQKNISASSPLSCSDTASSLVSSSMSQGPCGGGCPMCYHSLASLCAECGCARSRLAAIPILSLSNVSLRHKYFSHVYKYFPRFNTPTPQVPRPDPRPQELPQRPPLL